MPHTRNILKANLCLQLSYANILFHLADDALSSKPNLQNVKTEIYFCNCYAVFILRFFYLRLLMPTGLAIGSSVAPHHVCKRPNEGVLGHHRYVFNSIYWIE
jgi:hypothetical protein